MPEALNEIARTTGQQPLYSHNTLVVFGMDCAKSGLAAYLDFFSSDTMIHAPRSRCSSRNDCGGHPAHRRGG